jgi:acetyl esterase/lipase
MDKSLAARRKPFPGFAGTRALCSSYLKQGTLLRVMRFLVGVIITALANSCLAHGQQIDPPLRWATASAYEARIYPNLVYGVAEGHELKLDVITAGPDRQMRPTLIYIHGGGWSGGTKEEYQWFTLPFIAAGMNVVNVEYRVASVSLAPAAVEDCRCALRWVFRHSQEYGFDIDKLVLDGHSAGGHLSLMTGMLDANAGFDNNCPGKEDLKVAAIINYFGITDVTDVLQGKNQQDWAVTWFGSLPDKMDLAKRLSPLTYVRSGLPPIITIHGTSDPLVPYQEAVRLHEALDSVGAPNELITIPGGGHGSQFWSREDNWKAQSAIFDFLKKYAVISVWTTSAF